MTNFEFQRKYIFGWVVHVKTLQAGDTYAVKVTGDGNVPSNKTGNITLWTKGLITGVNSSTGDITLPRTKGYFSLDRDAIPSGEFKFTAEEDSEWVCVNYIANRKTLPNLRVIRCDSSSVVIPAGSNILFCDDGFSDTDGSYTKFDSKTFGETTELACSTGGLLLVFGEIKNVAT